MAISRAEPKKHDPSNEIGGKRICLVANSHIDPVWLWNKYEGIDEVINTFRSACDRLDEYPDLKFSASSALFYKWVERFAPDVFERVKTHVQTSRWEIVGGWLVEADCNLPTGVSFYRSAQISSKFLSDSFGVTTPVAYSPDSFGHAATLPKILAQTGFKYYIICRPSEEEKPDLPANLFYWEYEGSRVLCYRLKYHYTQGVHRDKGYVEKAFADSSFVRDGLACYFFGVGDHGGGPTKSEIDFLLAKRAEIKDRELVFSSCREFFEQAEKLSDIPVYSGDLHMHAVGCYSINRKLKNAIRSAEHKIAYTERIHDDDGGSSILHKLWEKTIFNQFHDIMPGSCSPEAESQALAEMGWVHDEVDQLSYVALKKMSAKLPVTCPEGEFRIYNSLPHPVTSPFEIESFMYYLSGAQFIDSNGRAIAVQPITPSVNCVNRRWVFVDTIPARTMKSYYFDSNRPSSGKESDVTSFSTGDCITCGGYTVGASGVVSHATLLRLPARLSVISDGSDTWSHGVSDYGKADTTFEQTSSSVQEGSVASRILLRQVHNHSSAEVYFTLYRDLPFVDLNIKVLWVESRSVLKLEFDMPRSLDSLLVQGPGGVIEKTKAVSEEPLHGWILSPGIGIVQDGAFAFDRRGNCLRITLVRSNLYGYDKSVQIDDLGPISHTDRHEHSFRFRLFFDDTLTASDMDRQHAAMVEPFHVTRDNR